MLLLAVIAALLLAPGEQAEPEGRGGVTPYSPVAGPGVQPAGEPPPGAGEAGVETGSPEALEPAYLLSVEPPVVVAPPGSEFTVALSLEGFNGFQGSVGVELAGVYYYSGGYASTPPRALVLEDLFRVEGASLEPGERVEVSVSVAPGAPPGSYLLALQPGSAGLLGAAGLLRVYVPAVPGYAVVPEPPESHVEPFKDVRVKINVVPVGGYSGVVELSYEKVGPIRVVSLEPRSGEPPFTAELVFRLEYYETVCSEDGECRSQRGDPWRGLPAGATANMNAFILVTARGGGAPPSQAAILVGLEEPPRRPSLLEALLYVLLLPLNIALSITLSATTGAAALTALAAAPLPTAYLEAGSIALEPYKLLAPPAPQGPPGGQGAPAALEWGSHWLRTSTVTDSGSYQSVLRIAAVSEARQASTLIASPRVPGEAHLRIYTPGGSEGVEIKLQAPEGGEARAEIEVTARTQSYIDATIRPTSPSPAEVILTVERNGTVIDRVELDLQPPTQPLEAMAEAEPGATVVAALPPLNPTLQTAETLVIEPGSPQAETLPHAAAYRYEPRSAELPGGMQAAIHEDYHIIVYLVQAPGGGYTKQGEELQPIPDTGRIDPAEIAKRITVISTSTATIVKVELRSDAKPGLYAILVTAPPTYQTIQIIIHMPPPQNHQNLQPLSTTKIIE